MKAKAMEIEEFKTDLRCSDGSEVIAERVCLRVTMEGGEAEEFIRRHAQVLSRHVSSGE